LVDEHNAFPGDHAMRTLMRSILIGLGIFVGLGTQLAGARDGVLNAVPADAAAFAVVHNLTEASRSIRELAKLVQAPAPDLLNLAKGTVGIQKGLDEQGDLAIVLATIDPVPKGMVLVPMSNKAEFFEALKVKVPASGAVEVVQLTGRPALVGRKGNFAAFALSMDQDALEQFLANTTTLAGDTSLTAWLDANKVSIVVTAKGVQQLLPKLTDGIRTVQAQMRQTAPAGNAASMADILNVYVDLLTAAEPEVDQFAVGLRIDSSQTVGLVKRAQFTPNGAWAQWAKNFGSGLKEPLAGLPAGPFVFTASGVVPPGAMDQLMKFSVQMMQKQPQYNLTPEQAQKYVELSKGMMSGVREMRVVLGVPESGDGLYGKMLAVLIVDDSQQFMQGYEKSLVEIREFVGGIKDSAIPIATTKRTKLGTTDVLEISTDLAAISKLAPPGGQDPQKMLKLMTGSSDKLNVYIAPADKHTVVMVYTSMERLKESLDFLKSNQPGLSTDAGLSKVAAALPPDSQIVSYVDIRGVTDVAREFVTVTPGARAAAIPEFSASPPLGMAVKFSSAGAEGHLVVTAETLRAIGDAVAKARGAASAPSN
jgi:hypothetical protein